MRFTYDNNYFNDKYQGIPVGGYNVLIGKLLEGVETSTGCDFFAEFTRDAVELSASQRIWGLSVDLNNVIAEFMFCDSFELMKTS